MTGIEVDLMTELATPERSKYALMSTNPFFLVQMVGATSKTNPKIATRKAELEKAIDGMVKDGAVERIMPHYGYRH